MQIMQKKWRKTILLCEFALKIRHISALYIRGDKAHENCVSLQPYMDFEKTFQNVAQLEHSIEKRKLSIDLKRIIGMFNKYKDGIKTKEKLEEERQSIAVRLKELSKTSHKDEDLINQLKEKGKYLRNYSKAMRTNFYSIEDDFIQAFLHLPNILHKYCPEGDDERILYKSQQQLIEEGKSHLSFENFIHFIENSRYYMLNEAAEFDIRCPQALIKYFLYEGDFIQTANPDFTRCVLLEANATPMNCYHKVMEPNLQNKLNAAYLTGGGSFESFLGAVTKLSVYPNVLPLKYVSCGRLYETSSTNTPANLFTATQNNSVQTFVATTDSDGADEQMENILNICADFYKIFDIHFRIIYVPASQLMPAESLRAQIEIYSPHEKRYISIGRVSNYKNFVSKRILFNMRHQNDYKFLHIVGGPVLYTSRLIAALIEHNKVLDYDILKTLNMKISKGDAYTNAVYEFKSVFE